MTKYIAGFFLGLLVLLVGCMAASAGEGIGFNLSLMKDMDILRTPLGKLVKPEVNVQEGP